MNAKIEVNARISGPNEFIFSFAMAPSPSVDGERVVSREFTKVLPVSSSVITPGYNAIVASSSGR